MIKTNFVVYSGKIIVEVIKDFIYFPIWWYSKGLWKVVLGAQNFLADWFKSLGLRVWVKNLFVPMYGQQDFAGRAISFFIRLFQIIFRSLVFLLLSILSVALILLWLFIPVIIVYQLIWQLL